MDAIAVQSYDFVNSRYFVSPDHDIVAIFSHRGTKAFSLRALELAKEQFGATTVLITGSNSPISNKADICIETCPQENCGAFTISLTSAIVRILQWVDMYSEGLIERFKIWLESFRLPFDNQKLPKFSNKLILVGDLIREPIAHEVALKISETTYLPVRSYGLEQFLHGPRVTLDNESSIIAFTASSQDRQSSLIKYANTIGIDLIEVNDNQQSFVPLPKEFNWLAQLVWGQQLTLELARKLGTNPDTMRRDQNIYVNANKELSL
jgi:fructoselysine-6-P-deglycase FrlB-like protein